MFGETYIPRQEEVCMCVCMHVCMYVCMYAWSPGTYLQSIPSMYVCPGKHTYLENDRNVWYVCMSGETYIPRQEEVCMYVCMHGPNVHTSKARVCTFLGYIEESYVSRIHRRVVHTQYVCMSGETDIPRKLEVCMVCMDVWGKIYT